jgi:hypothetical protein
VWQLIGSGASRRGDLRAEIRLEYRFRSLPGDWRPKYITLGIFASHNDSATPRVEQFPIEGMSGEATPTYPSFLPPPEVALASPDIGNGLSSRTVKVLIVADVQPSRGGSVGRIRRSSRLSARASSSARARSSERRERSPRGRPLTDTTPARRSRAIGRGSIRSTGSRRGS